MTDVSPKKIIRAALEEIIDSGNDVDLKQAAREITAELIEDREFCCDFTRAFLYSTVYEIGLRIMSQRRQQVLSGLRTMTAEDVKRQIEEGPTDWSRWMEHDPGTGTYVSLFQMTKEQAIAAAEEREQRVAPDLRRAALLRLAAGRLEPGERIQDRWTAEQLSSMEDKLVVERPVYKFGKKSIMQMIQEGAFNE